MTVQEFSDQFDVLYNNITSNQAPGLNEYEKSIFLTKAQEEIIKNYFSPKGNPKQEGFDDSPKRQSDFAAIIKTSALEPFNTNSKFDQRSKVFAAPVDMFICLNEQLSDDGNPLTVVPISYSEYDRLMSKPYKYPPKYQAWRLTTDIRTLDYSNIADFSDFIDGTSLVIEQVGLVGTPDRILWDTHSNMFIGEKRDVIVTPTSAAKYYNAWTHDESYHSNISYYAFRCASDGKLYVYNGTTLVETSESAARSLFEIIAITQGTLSYKMRYIRRPNPIILVKLSDIQNGLSIQGKSNAMTSELSEELHEEILQRAVELAKIAWAGDPASIIQAGQRSE